MPAKMPVAYIPETAGSVIGASGRTSFTPQRISNRADLIPVVEVIEEIEPDPVREILDRLSKD